MSKQARTYPPEYKVEEVKLCRETGTNQAAFELGVPYSTLYGWVNLANTGGIDTGAGTQSPQSATTQAAEIQRLRAENKELTKENKRLNEINEFLEEAASFFAASRKKSTK
jgi:transposase